MPHRTQSIFTPIVAAATSMASWIVGINLGTVNDVLQALSFIVAIIAGLVSIGKALGWIQPRKKGKDEG